LTWNSITPFWQTFWVGTTKTPTKTGQESLIRNAKAECSAYPDSTGSRKDNPLRVCPPSPPLPRFGGERGLGVRG
jgi:hypothetical protein